MTPRQAREPARETIGHTHRIAKRAVRWRRQVENFRVGDRVLAGVVQTSRDEILAIFVGGVGIDRFAEHL